MDLEVLLNVLGSFNSPARLPGRERWSVSAIISTFQAVGRELHLLNEFAVQACRMECI
jgi:hypothetical protein